MYLFGPAGSSWIMQRIMEECFQEDLMRGIFTNRTLQGMVKYPEIKKSCKPLSPPGLKRQGERTVLLEPQRSVTGCESIPNICCV